MTGSGDDPGAALEVAPHWVLYDYKGATSAARWVPVSCDNATLIESGCTRPAAGFPPPDRGTECARVARSAGAARLWLWRLVEVNFSVDAGSGGFGALTCWPGEEWCLHARGADLAPARWPYGAFDPQNDDINEGVERFLGYKGWPAGWEDQPRRWPAVRAESDFEWEELDGRRPPLPTTERLTED